MEISPKSGQSWRIVDLVRWGESYFREKGFRSPRLEMEYLLTALLNYKRVDLYLNFEEPVTPKELARLKVWIKRRLKHEPLQYILGETDFYGRTFTVAPPTLIPRPETERLIDAAISKIMKLKSPTILDVGTGSGCIAITLALECKDVLVMALDASEKAIGLAKMNANHLSANIEWIQKPMEDFQPEKPFDIVVSNPPYITADEYTDLMPEVKDYEDPGALTDNSDGLTLTRQLVERKDTLLKSGGWMIVEVGRPPQPELAEAIFQEHGFKSIELIKDYNGDDRVLIARMA